MSSNTNHVTLGSVGTTTGQIPETVNDFSIESTNSWNLTYEDDEGNQVSISHSKAGAHGRRRSYTLTLHDADGNKLQTRTINHGPYTDRDITDATDAIETQLWEWARHSVSDRFPIQADIEALGEPNPHPPGERPTVSDAWYFSYSPDTKKVDDPNSTLSSYGSYVPTSRYEFMASNDSNNWYCGQLIVTFNHEAPDSITTEPDHVYGTYIYLSLTPLKPVSERINEYNTKEINRRCIRHDESHEALSHDKLLEIISDAQEELREDAEAIGDEHRQEIIAEADRRLNEETGEYEDQIRLTGF